MSAPMPHHAAELPISKLDQDRTTDLTTQVTSTDPNATKAYVAPTTELPRQVIPSIPGYEIEGELGRGGMGVVYRARQTDLNRPVAIKMILGGKYSDPVAQARFLVEAEVIAAIQHPHIVQVFEFGRHDDQPYFVLEYVGGGSLAAKLKATGRFVSRDAAIMVAKLADGMATAHQKGVVHRDLKPANVLLTDMGEPKITDFGLAKTSQSDLTMTGAVMGTPSYMSPEQAAGKTRELGTPTDVYALGAILYELLTGRAPFKGDTAMSTLEQVLTQEPERLRTIDPKISSDLETICLKCLEKDAQKRYATAAALVMELNAYLAGRPIAARPVGTLERTWKWMKRNPAWAAGIAAAILILGIATALSVLIREQVIEQQKATHAAGMVQAILHAETSQVPGILAEMAPYRPWVDPLLRMENTRAAINSRQRLHTSLALMPVDATQRDYLYGRLLDAKPQEVPVIGDALASQKAALIEKLWSEVQAPEQGKDLHRLRAAAALAKYDPDGQRWGQAGPLVVNDLVKENLLFLGQWSEAFRPVKKHMLPALEVFFRDPQVEHATERSLATTLLADYAADQPPLLVDLLLDANEKQFGVVFEKFQEHGERGIPLLSAEIDRKLAADAKEEAKEKRAKRQANAAVALLRMNHPAKVWPLLKFSPDDRLRSYLIHRLGPMGVDAQIILKRLDEETELSSRRALILILGEFPEKALSPQDRKNLLKKLQETYRTHSDPGLHAACEWVLRKWKQDPWLKEVVKDWATDKTVREKRLADIQLAVAQEKEKTPPQWYVNAQGQTMVVIPGPVQFVMGSPRAEAGRHFNSDGTSNERQHQRQIRRVFALAAAPVTKEQFLRFSPSFFHVEFTRYPEPTCAVGGIDWNMAAAYCNWLSKQEAIPEEQWCYEITNHIAKLKTNYLSLVGYRLPTEAEMEYATRAGTTTSRYYGETEELLSKYVWYQGNSKEQTWPVGSLKPNELGLFDTLGNVFTWCLEIYKDYPAVKGDASALDREEDLTVTSKEGRVLRGGSISVQGAYVRAANRHSDDPTFRDVCYGFRIARTIPLALPAALPSSPIRK